MIDLADLVPSLIASITVPGSTEFDDVPEESMTLNLSNGFWGAVLDGVISGYTESDGLVTPISGSTDLSRELQQVVVLYAAIDIVSNKLLALQTNFRAKAGPVEYEVQQSATILKAVFDRLAARQKLLLDNLSKHGNVSPAYVDMLVARNASIAHGLSFFADY